MADGGRSERQMEKITSQRDYHLQWSQLKVNGVYSESRSVTHKTAVLIEATISFTRSM